jgi:hypothetical protein
LFLDVSLVFVVIHAVLGARAMWMLWSDDV